MLKVFYFFLKQVSLFRSSSCVKYSSSHVFFFLFFCTYKMTTKQMNIKNRTYYFYNVLINIKDFDVRLLKLDKKTPVGLAIYCIGYVTKKPEWNVNSVNPLYLIINRIDGFIEEKNGDRYLNIRDTDKKSRVLKTYLEVWSGIKDFIEKINDSELGEYDKDFMKTKFNSDNDIPLNKLLNVLSVTVII